MRARRHLAVALLCATAALAANASAARANPVDAFGLGARSVALGGAMTSNAVDYSANYYNPAGLAAENDLRLEVGYIYDEPWLYLNGGDLDVDPNYGVQGGVVMPGELFGHRIGVSFGTFIPGERISRIRALPQNQPRWEMFDNRPQRLYIASSAGFEIVHDLYFGGGLTYLSNTEGSLEITGQAGLTDVEETTFFSAVDVDLSSIRYPTFGLLWTPGDWRFGLAYREQFSLRLDLTVDVQGDVVTGGIPLVEDASFVLITRNSNLFAPRQVALGATWEHRRWLVTGDLTWHQWSRFEPPASDIEITLDLGNIPFGIPPTSEPIDPDFHDILLPRLGAEYDLVDTEHLGVTARAGYSFEPSPAPDQPAITNYVDSTKHSFCTGLGFRFEEFTAVFPRPLLLDLGFQYTTLPLRAYEKTDPADPVGDFEADGYILGGSVSASFLF